MKQTIIAFARYWGTIVVTAARNWITSQAFVYAGALAFFTLFSIAPVVIVAVTIVGVVLGERAARGQIMAQLEDVIGTDAAEAVETAVTMSQIDHSGWLPTVLGITAMVVGATTVFAQLQISLNRIWDVAPKPSRNTLFLLLKARVLSLTIVLAIGFILLVSLLVSVAVRAFINFAEDWLVLASWILTISEIGLSFAVIAALFATIFRVLPDVALSWRDVLPGAVVTAVLFTLGRSLIALYLAQTATASTYGAAGSLALLLLWVYFSSLILLYGAAFTRAHLEARGKPIVPRNTAVCVHTELIEDTPTKSCDT